MLGVGQGVDAGSEALRGAPEIRWPGLDRVEKGMGLLRLHLRYLNMTQCRTTPAAMLHTWMEATSALTSALNVTIKEEGMLVGEGLEEDW